MATISPIRSKETKKLYSTLYNTLDQLKRVEPDSINKLIKGIITSSGHQIGPDSKATYTIDPDQIVITTITQKDLNSVKEIESTRYLLKDSSEVKKADKIFHKTFDLAEEKIEDSINDRIGQLTDVISAIKNIWRTVKNSDIAAILHLGAISGFFSIITGSLTMRNGMNMIKRSVEIGDSEGVKKGSILVILGLLNFLQGIVMVTSKVALLAGKLTISALAGLGFYILIPLSVLVSASYGGFIFNTVRDFRKELRSILDDKNFSEKEKLEKAALFIHKNLSVSTEELEKIENELASIRATSEERYQNELNKKVDNLLETKRTILTRRIGEKAFNVVAQDLKKVISGIKTEDFDIEKAKLLVEEVSKGSLHQVIISIACITLAFLGTAISALMFTFGTPLSFFLILGIMSIIWLGIDSSSLSQKLFADLPWYVKKKLYTNETASRFRKELYRILENPDLGEKEKMEKAIFYLHRNLLASTEELNQEKVDERAKPRLKIHLLPKNKEEDEVEKDLLSVASKVRTNEFDMKRAKRLVEEVSKRNLLQLIVA